MSPSLEPAVEAGTAGEMRAVPLMSSPVLTQQRRELVLEAVQANHSARVPDLAKRFSVSEMTIRRDLRALATDGRLLRVRGGAIAEGLNRPFAEVEIEHFSEKSRIGAAAANLVIDRETVLLDLGTTPLQLARHLKNRQLTVITCNLAVYEELLPKTSIELILLGGRVDRAYRSLGGFLVEDALTQLSADRVFMSAVGLRPDLSVMDDAMGEMRVKRAMIAAAGSVVLMLDSSKFGVEGGARVCGSEEIDVLVTDTDAPTEMVQALEQRGVRVICV